MSNQLSYDITLLLKQVAEGDEKAFRLVFDHYKGPFYTVAFKMTRSPKVAEEITQEAFVNIWVKRNLIAAAKNPNNYVFAILRNCIYFHFRRLAHERLLKFKLENEIESSENSIETLLDEKEDRDSLESIISQLPPQQKIIYKLAKQENMNRDEIARKLNISPNTVRNHLSSAVEHLRASLRNGIFTLIWLFNFIQF